MKILIIILSISIVNSEIIKTTVKPNEKISFIGPPIGRGTVGITDTQWIFETDDNFKIQAICTLKVHNCLKATLTIDTGKDETSYCGPKANRQILRTSVNNKLEVSLLTNNVESGNLECTIGTMRSFLGLPEAIIDSSEAGFGLANKKTTCSCGTARNSGNARIVGGKEAKINQYSFPVVIVRSDKKIAFCGGSIITEYHILTAAHCTYTLAPDVPLTVGVGEHDLTKVTETNATQMVHVDRVIRHENFDGVSKLYDISILVLKDKIKFNSLIGPVCLPVKGSKLNNEIVRVMGWGRLFDGGFQSDVLMKTDLRVIDFQQCSEYYRKLKLTDPNQFCTYDKGKDTCTGDSGGPVLWLDPEINRYVQVGVVSYGNGCASDSMPAVNTDVHCFLDWIQKIIQDTKPTETCTKID